MTNSARTFLEWARKSLVPLATVKPGPPWDDLAPLGRMIGDATVVALSEGVHCGAEPLEFRNRLFEYLVREKGFTTIAIESGLAEGRTVHDYVRGGPGDLDSVVAQGITWTFDRVPQYRALVHWIREYNADASHPRKLNFYGFDVPGSPGNGQAWRGIDAALVETLKYLDRVDAETGATYRERLAPFMKSLRFGMSSSIAGPSYEQLSQAQRDTLTSVIEDMIALMERREGRYIDASSTSDYAWGYRSAIGARQTDAWLRHVPIGWKRPEGPPEAALDQMGFFSPATDSRDRAQADNIEWIIEREGPGAKILVFAARYHVSTMPVKSGYRHPDGTEREQQVAGTYLRRRLGERLITIGNAIGGGKSGCGDHHSGLERATTDSIDGLAGEVGNPLFLLDMRAAPAAAAAWLNEERPLAHPSVFKMAFGRAFDVLFYIDTVTASDAERSR